MEYLGTLYYLCRLSANLKLLYFFKVCLKKILIYFLPGVVNAFFYLAYKI